MAGRPSRTRRLDVWMNAELVGQWRITTNGVQQFAYDPGWPANQAARPLSLSLPLSFGTRTVSGQAVASYFDNLLPDSTAVRAWIASRHGAASDEAFDLLEKIGRDCVGAVQLLPAEDALRISLAGAQEKTAFLYHEGLEECPLPDAGCRASTLERGREGQCDGKGL
jgi:serine/threonine-protein kinase HipA